MTILNQLIKEIGSKTTKGAITNFLGILMKTEESDESSASTSSAWNEIERKLQDVFGSGDKVAAGRPARNKQVGLAVIVLVAIAIAVLVYRRRTRTESQTDPESSEA